MESIMNTYPEQWFIYWNLSLCYWENGERKKALSTLHEGIEKYDWWKYYGRIARIYLDQEKSDEALRYLYLALNKFDPDEEDAFSTLSGFTDDFVGKGFYNDVIQFLIHLNQKYPKSMFVMEMIVNSFYIFYPELDDTLKEESGKYIHEYQNGASDCRENENFHNMNSNVALGVINIEEGRREKGWELLKKAHELKKDETEPLYYMVEYSKKNREYLEIIDLIHSYLTSITVGYDYNKAFLMVLDTLIEKVRTSSIKCIIENIKLEYTN